MPAKVKVKLLKEHEHGGRLYPAGAKLELWPHDADWLHGIKVAEKQSSADQAPAADKKGGSK